VADHRWVGRGVGKLYAANTAGNIAGSLLAGHLLIPVLGSSASLVVLGLVYVAGGLVIMAWRGRLRSGLVLVATAASAASIGWLWLAGAVNSPGTLNLLASLRAGCRPSRETERGRGPGAVTTRAPARGESRRSAQPDLCPRWQSCRLTGPQLEPTDRSPGVQHTVCRRSSEDRWPPCWTARAPRNGGNSRPINYLRHQTPSPRGLVDEV